MNKPVAAIIDLDGVITQTASQHAKAWKQLFDYYFDSRGGTGKDKIRPFEIENDYPKYIDGMPRVDGIRNLLKSRNMELPLGSREDPAGNETLWGLGNLKNNYFLDIIDKEGVQLYKKNIGQIRKWKEQGMKTAVISSSENCKKILEACGIEDLFDTRVDGIISNEKGLKGKPAPDIFLEAAKELKVDPEQALIVEDSLAGVEAGKKGSFGWVIGVEVNASKDELQKHGASQVVKSLEEVDLQEIGVKFPHHLPSALDSFEKLKEKFKGTKPYLFLDFDGTLAPIVDYYRDAALSSETRALLEKLKSKFLMVVISGRGLEDVKQKVDIDTIFYVGSHGFEIQGPDGYSKEQKEAKESLKALDEIEKKLRSQLTEFAGSEVERKKYALAIHYRQVDPSMHTSLKEIVTEAGEGYPEVKISGGKKVMEVKPNLDWHKGKAVGWLVSEFKKPEEEAFVLYLGDDLTDEDAFSSMKNGLGILVGNHGGPTAADYSLKDVDEVNKFLTFLMKSEL